MKERPILFSAPMVRAILSGVKTQTRRVVKYNITGPNPPTGIYDWHDQRTGEWKGAHGAPTPFGLCNAARLCPYGVPGDRLIVKEALHRDGNCAAYAADGLLVCGTAWAWQRDYLASMFMPRAASRITLEITDVRVERLQEISEADAIAEGIAATPWAEFPPVEAFKMVWDATASTHWNDNPWVWMLTFRRVAP